MSAWFLGEDHIRLIAQAALLYLPEIVESDPDAFCLALHAENARSYSYRYPDDPAEAVPFGYEPVVRGESPIAFRVLVLKAIHCYRYQSCEHEEWDGSAAKAMVERLHDVIREDLKGKEVSICRYHAENEEMAGGPCCCCEALPGWSEAPGWEFRRGSLGQGRPLAVILA